MHISSAFSPARRRKVPQSRLIPACLCQGSERPPVGNFRLRGSRKARGPTQEARARTAQRNRPDGSAPHRTGAGNWTFGASREDSEAVK